MYLGLHVSCEYCVFCQASAYPVCQERSFDATEDGVYQYADGKQQTSSIAIHSRQVRVKRGSTDQKVDRCEDLVE